MAITPDKLSTIHLDQGVHDGPAAGMCLLEAVAYLSGLPWSDNPPCVSPVLAEFGRQLNDVLPDDTRQQLVPLIPLLAGTAGDGHDETRGWRALDWLIRVFAATWLDVAGLSHEAAALRDLGRIVDVSAAEHAAPVVKVGCHKATVAGDAAWAAAGDAARDAWAAAQAAQAAARAAPGDAAWAAAWAAGWAATAAARAAATDRLGPTVADLQASAIALYRRMITLDPEGAA